ncbi:MAG: hypothetical protein HXX16_10310 [Bacteroidales bacterium]|nr:hypothetical protein [Bacteroidales bacterium]
MKKRSIFSILIMLTFLLSSCESYTTKDISKDGSVETFINIEHINNNHDVIKTSHKVWVKNILTKTITYTDTIPSLGNTEQVAENDEGDAKNVNIRKEYEVYVTVK